MIAAMHPGFSGSVGLDRPPMFDTVNAPLAHWARLRPQALALADDAQGRWSFAALNEAVTQRARAYIAGAAPATVWVAEQTSVAERLIDFLAIVSSGRAAAVADPEWPAVVRSEVERWFDTEPAALASAAPLTPFYVGFTSGSTGMPKGFRRHHRSWTESLDICLRTFGAAAATPVLAPGRVSHSLFLFGMLQGLWSGAGVHVQQRFSATRALATLAQGQARCLVAVPSQLLLMLELAARRRMAPVTATELLLISGARWMRARTPALQALFPRARIIEFYGASETSFMAWTEADAALPPGVVGRPFVNVEVEIRPPVPASAAIAQLEPEPSEAAVEGLIYIRSPMLFSDYVGPGDGSAALRDGDWLSVRDMGHLDDQGRLWLAGRQQRMIVTRGKNLFPEEVEAVLASHPAIAEVAVLPRADALRGSVAMAVLLVRPGQTSPTAQALAQWCRQRLEPFKVPRRFWLGDDWPRTASGKSDLPELARRLAQALVPAGADRPSEATACLQPLH